MSPDANRIQPAMHEPSVLDYVKARLRFWEKSDLRIPDSPQEAQPLEVSSENLSMITGPDAASYPAEGSARQEVTTRSDTAIREAVRFPWLVLLPVATALCAQLFLEPPARLTTPAVVLYLISAVLVALAFTRGDLRLAERAAPVVQIDDANFHWVRALIALPFALAAFVFLGGNQFTLVNTMLWLVSIVFFVAAFSRADQLPDLSGGLSRFWQALRQPGSSWTSGFHAGRCFCWSHWR